jgi:hypothetical protein
VLFASEGDGPVFGDEAVIVGMGREEIESAAASIHGRARSPDGGEKIKASAAAEQREKFALVRKAFVKRGGGTSAIKLFAITDTLRREVTGVLKR